MATTKIGIYRKYHGPVPKDELGQPLPKCKWLNTRPCSWAARWFGLDGKRYSKSFKTRKEAERFAETRQIEVRNGGADPPASCTMRAFIKEHMELAKGAVRRTTLLLHVAAWKHLARQMGWDLELRKVTVKDIERYRSSRAESTTVKSTATLNKEIKVLKRLFNLAIQRRYLVPGANPAAQVQLARVGQKKPRYVAPATMEKIVQAAHEPELRAFLVLVYASGLRKNEAIHLLWSHIDFVGRVVHVARRDDDGCVQQWEPKDHERREIPLPDRALEILRELQDDAPQRCPYVFMDRDRWKCYQARVAAQTWVKTSDLINNLLRRFKTCCKRAGVGAFTLHDLRRSCITNWAKLGLPIHVVQQLAGHADIETTRQYYLSVQDDDLTKAREIQQGIVGEMELGIPTDPKLTHLTTKRSFMGRKEFENGLKVPEKKGVL